jgi:hypothetical protein
VYQSLTGPDASHIAYCAAFQFGRFAKLLSDFPLASLCTTIPNFHNLEMRYQQFENAIAGITPEYIDRLHESADLVAFLQSQRADMVDRYKVISDGSTSFRLRVMHHDCKISNILFSPPVGDEAVTAVAVIDLDTVMPGYVISDIGDMLRTYVCAADEDFPVSVTQALACDGVEAIAINEKVLLAVVSGYLHAIRLRSDVNPNGLSIEEAHCFMFAGKFMLYMQALRFLTDYLQGDPYYGAKRQRHNLTRACNQTALYREFVRADSRLGPQIDALVAKLQSEGS